MAVTRRTIRFLPSIFQTDANRKFLSSTLDQLVSEPNFKRINGFVGRRFSTAYEPNENYVEEASLQRKNYQLEIGFTTREDDSTIKTYAGYSDLVNRIGVYGGITNDHDRLFNNEYYSYSPPIDIDKLVNYKNYYWMPVGPEAIKITSRRIFSNTTINFTDQFTYISTNLTGSEQNPKLYLKRGVTYTINTSMFLGNLYIQSEPGSNGIKQYSYNSSSRAVAGVTNNGSSTITFTPPVEGAQDVYLQYPLVDHVEYAISETLAVLDNSVWNFGEGMSGQLSGDQFYPDNTDIIFINNSSDPADWTNRFGTIIPEDRRTGVFRLSTVKYSGQPVRIEVDFVRNIEDNTRVLVNLGTSRGKEYVTSSGSYIEFNGITGEHKTLYYQHSGRDYFGVIELVEPGINYDINVSTIIGSVNYVTPNGVQFTNGMKVSFDDTVLPTSYRNKTYFVEGVGESIALVDYDRLVVPEILEATTQIAFESKQFDVGNFDESLLGSNKPDYIVVNRNSLDNNAWSRINRWVHYDVIKTSFEHNNIPLDFSNLSRADRPIIEFKGSLQLYNTGRNFRQFVDQFFDENFRYVYQGQPNRIDNILETINGARFRDLAAKKINLVAGQTAIFATDTNYSKTIYRVNRLDQASSTVFDRVVPNNQTSITGTISMTGTDRVTGSNTNFTTELEIGCDLYLADRSYLGRVKQILGSNDLILESPINYFLSNYSGVLVNYARVVLSEITTCDVWDSIVVLSGTNTGISFYLDIENKWSISQQKKKLNQPPLFDIVTLNGTSLDSYPESTFAGSPLFSYGIGSGTNDIVLGFPMKYSGTTSFTSDILFDNNYDHDSFYYRVGSVLEDKVKTPINIGYIRKNLTSSRFDVLTNFSSAGTSKQFQHIEAKYDAVTNYFEISQDPKASLDSDASIRVYVNNKFLRLQTIDDPEYSIEYVNETVAVKINHNLLTKGDKVDIFVYAASPIKSGYYEIPKNLEFNPFNQTFDQVSFGQLRNHLERIGENHKDLVGEVFGSSNLRDIKLNVGGTLIQNSASLIPAMAFLTNQQINFINSIDFAVKEYERFKYKFFETIGNHIGSFNKVPDIVDEVLLSFAQVKNQDFPWYYSDMVPFGKNFLTTTIRVTNPGQRTYNLNNSISIEPSNRALLIYVNDVLITRDIDYVINTNNITVTISSNYDLKEYDIITFKEFQNTNGSYIPETPTKLGLYPKFYPQKILDESTGNGMYLIQGHDGSLFPAFNDIRDDLILELERRIYSNIKVNYNPNLVNIHQFMPGKFRSTEYTRNEFNNVLGIEFLKWVGENQLDYSTNRYFSPNDEWTWNYNQSVDFDGDRLPGYWRGVYRYYYDTDRPDSHPWEMLGYSVKPTWWDTHYSWSDLVKRSNLIQALKNGRRLIPTATNYLTATNSIYARANIEQYVPVGIDGQLLSPQKVLVTGFNSERLSKNFGLGDYGPVETAWARTSNYAYAIQKCLALLKPARYFGILFDTYNVERRTFGTLSQYFSKKQNVKFSFKDIIINGETVNGTTTYSAGYINWIHGYLTSLGFDANSKLREFINYSAVNLSYKFGGFTDKNYITVLANQISLTSTSESVVIPNESYDIFLNKSLPQETITYSGVIIEKTSRGYTVTGYDQRLPYFIIIPSRSTGTNYKMEILGENVTIFEKYFPQKIRIPYGFEFTSIQQVVDFLVGYQRYLVAQGLVFDEYDSNLKTVKNWLLSVKEFVTWSKQGWKNGNILVLSPVNDSLSVFTENYFVDTIDNYVYGSQIVGTNFNVIRNNDFTVLRENKRTTIKTLSEQTIALIRLNLVQFEHVLVLDNTTIFNDVILNPAIGDRQYKLKLLGSVTNSWDGDLTPPGFVYSNGIIDQWLPNYDYRKGSIVSYKGLNYSALENIDGSEIFNFNKWTKLDSVFREGLAPNFSQNAVKFDEIYDVDNLPTNESLAAYSNSLIGFKPRSFLDNLGVSGISQIKFYQGYIKTKGTKNAITAFAKGRFDDVDATIDLYEEWAARLGSYGAIDSNPEYSFLIKNSLYDNDPLLFEFLNSNSLAESEKFVTLTPSNLLAFPIDYSPQVFLNRNDISQISKSWKIEMFGDSIMCGKNINSSQYAVGFIKRHGYSVDVQTLNKYSIAVTDVQSGEAKSFVRNNESLKIAFSSLDSAEDLYITIEPVVENDRPLTTSAYKTAVSSADVVLPSTDLLVNFTTRLPFERVWMSLEPISANELPRTKLLDGSVYYPDSVKSGTEAFIQADSLLQTEELYYTIEEVAATEFPETTTLGLGELDFTRVCFTDKVSGRVNEPPDYLLYQELSSEYEVAITTRSVEGSTTASLLNGNDGVNGVWPDNIEADIVILNHGFEDAKNGVDIEVYKENLRMIRRRLPANKIVIWQTPAQLDLNNPNTNFESPGIRDLKPYANAMRAVALENSDYVVDVNSMPDYLSYISVDGIHPTQEGYRAIVTKLLAPTVKQAIDDYLSSQYQYYEDDLKTAGYAMADEVDVQIFDIKNYSLFDAELLTNLVTGYKIWVAKDFNNDWQVYRATLNPTTITRARAGLNNQIVLTCSSLHYLSIGDMVAVRNIDASVNGFYQVLSTTDIEFIVEKLGVSIDLNLTNRTGTLFDFDKMRFKTLSHARAYQPKRGWLAYDPYVINPSYNLDLVYIDRGLNNSWQIYRPKKVDTVYKQVFYSNVITANTYSIIGINCIVANSLVSTVTYGEQINFCVFSNDDSENLYYTIEPATAADLASTPIIDGTLVSYSNSSVEVGTDIYDFDLIRSAEPIVDIESIKNLYIYDIKDRNILTRVDLYDPNKGKILGQARADIDIISDDDPASYRNTDNSSEYRYSEEIYWGNDQVGTYWWNTNQSRFIDYEQGDLDYRASNWGKLFPGSTIEVYEWIVSDVLPSVHVSEGREGTPLFANDEYYSDSVFVDPDTNTFVSRYFFWVKGRTNKTAKHKNSSTASLAEMILNPSNQGIPYMSALRNDTIALYNVGSYTQTDNAVMFIATKKLLNEKIIHSDFKLLQEGNTLKQFPDLIEQKLIDSLAGVDASGNPVPDPKLGKFNQIGLSIRPRQTLIVDLPDARRNFISYINSKFEQYPVVFKIRDNNKIYSDNLFAKDPEPDSSEYDYAVDYITDIYIPPQTKATIKILVRFDATYGGFWAFYDRTGVVNVLANSTNTTVRLIRKQSFDVTTLWEYKDWYKTGYSSSTVPTYTIDEFKDIYKLTLSNGDIIRVNNFTLNKTTSYGSIVTRNQQMAGDWEMYVYTFVDGKSNLELIGIQNKTIRLKDILYRPDGFDVGDFDVPLYDSNSLTELRYVLAALKQDIFVDDLKDEYNIMLFSLIDYILTEQKYIDWFFKTSFVTIVSKISGLNQLPSLVKDRQKNIESYVQEVKPYRTKIREFVNAYDQIDTYQLGVTDFDLQPYYDKNLNVYRSPSGEYPDIDLVEIQRPEYQEWVNNHKYTLGEVVISRPGYGFKTPDNSEEIVPSVEVIRTDLNSGQEANVSIEIASGTYGISKAYVIDSGTNFTSTPTIRLIGTGSTKPIDAQRHEFTVVSQGYSYFTVGERNKLGFGLFGRGGKDTLATNYQNSLLNVLDWTEGSGGTSNFQSIGLVVENQRVRDQDPWNNSSIVWENRPSGDGDADGGWNHVNFNINPTKTYRSVVWMRRTTSDSGGSLYHGLHTNGSWPSYAGSTNPTGSVRRLVDGAGEENPYWNFRSAADYTQGEWYLHVGHIFPADHTGTAAHPDSGIYTRLNGKVLINSGNLTDCKFPPNATQAMQRCYHYYCNDSSTRSQFAFPRFEELNDSAPSVQELLNYGPYQDVLYSIKNRGYHFHRIRRSDGQVVTSEIFDIYAQNQFGYTGRTSSDLAKELQRTTDEYVVVIHTYDEPSLNRLTQQPTSLLREMLRCGASREVFAGQTFKFRSSYILVGIPGCGEGRGIEHYAGSIDNAADAYCSIKFKIERGYLAPLVATPQFYKFSFPFALPENPKAGESYTYGERSYVYNGYRWTGTKTVTSTLSGNREPISAQLSPRLRNLQTRKLITTIKFDRVSYKSSVVDWQSNVTYFKGNIISYNGQAYQVTSQTYRSVVFTTSNLSVISSESFDNANDRIMGFYVPENSQSVPKDLKLLVNGIDPLYSTYTGSSSSTQDTILLGDTFGSNAGISAGNIKISGGKFVDRIFSHAPEELLPGYVYDSLSIRVLTQGSGSITTTTTAAPVGPHELTLNVFGKTETTIEVPYNEPGFSTTETYAIGFLGSSNSDSPQAITVRLLANPAGGTAVISPSSFSLLPGQQQSVTVTATNNMLLSKNWLDMSAFGNNFELLDNSPTWSIDKQGVFTFNSGVNVNDRASSVGTMTGINTDPGGYNTISFWMRWTGDNNAIPMEFKTNYRLWMPGGALGFNNGGGDLYGVTALEFLPFKNSWVFVTAVFHNTISGSTYVGYNKIYINGVSRTLTQVNGSATSGTAGIGITIANSSDPAVTPDVFEFGGDIGEFYAYNRELSEDEVLSLYFQTRDRYSL